jgi:predicted HTH domain antitoxin
LVAGQVQFLYRVEIDLPEGIVRELEKAWTNLPRRALEAVAAEGYRSGALSSGQVGTLLGLSFHETEEFLKEHLGFLQYDESDLDRDRTEIDRILPR